MWTYRYGLILATLLLASPAFAQRPESRQTVAPRPGVTLPFILTEPPTAPVASVILFTGGEGALGFTGPGPYPRGANFLVRNRQRFASHGLLVAVIDVPSDHAGGYGRYRMTEGHARDVAAVIAALRQLAPEPVWLVGTSKGSISAVNVAARLETGGADGLVITSSPMKSRGIGETVYDAGLGDVRIPTLVVHHEQDACSGTPGTDARMLGKSVRAPRTELLLFRGGAGGGTGDTACGPFSAHGYFGIDDEVVKAIADWIKR
jgi:predicted alpha/beta-hydrolase family hydrolase